MIAIDLGSNTLRVIRYDCVNDERIDEYEKIVRTADGLVERGVIGDENIERVVAALDEARVKMGFETVERAVTTEAIRRAGNACAVIEKIHQKTGVLFEIIDGEKEAFLTLVAVRKRLKKLTIDTENFLLFDLGGGSTELTIVSRDRVVSKSFPVGILTMVQKYRKLHEMSENLDQELQDMKNFTEKNMYFSTQNSLFVATAGTPTTLAAFKQGMDYRSYDYQAINGALLTREEITTLFKQLMAMEREERCRWVGVGRDDLIVAGIIIYLKVMEIVGFDSSIVIDDGLREGVAIEECNKKRV
jgi:exopolyphosphatase/guanosine-5'-triphosphate,3'-diphosphate pyrophosphatase